MQIKRNCETCQKEFTASRGSQRWCCRKCFKKAYYLRCKEKKQIEDNKKPIYICPICGLKKQLDFDPTKNRHRLGQVVCSNCQISNQTAFEHRYDTSFVVGNKKIEQYKHNKTA